MGNYLQQAHVPALSICQCYLLLAPKAKPAEPTSDTDGWIDVINTMSCLAGRGDGRDAQRCTQGFGFTDTVSLTCIASAESLRCHPSSQS
jgi:hypothetical protein